MLKISNLKYKTMEKFLTKQPTENFDNVKLILESTKFG